MRIFLSLLTIWQSKNKWKFFWESWQSDNPKINEKKILSLLTIWQSRNKWKIFLNVLTIWQCRNKWEVLIPLTIWQSKLWWSPTSFCSLWVLHFFPLRSTWGVVGVGVLSRSGAQRVFWWPSFDWTPGLYLILDYSDCLGNLGISCIKFCDWVACPKPRNFA